jgi:hypothetical protein
VHCWRFTGVSAVYCFHCSSRWRHKGSEPEPTRGSLRSLWSLIESGTCWLQMAARPASWTRQGTRACVTAQTRRGRGRRKTKAALAFCRWREGSRHVAIDASTVRYCCFARPGFLLLLGWATRPGPPDKRSSEPPLPRRPRAPALPAARPLLGCFLLRPRGSR